MPQRPAIPQGAPQCPLSHAGRTASLSDHGPWLAFSLQPLAKSHNHRGTQWHDSDSSCSCRMPCVHYQTRPRALHAPVPVGPHRRPFAPRSASTGTFGPLDHGPCHDGRTFKKRRYGHSLTVTGTSAPATGTGSGRGSKSDVHRFDPIAALISPPKPGHPRPPPTTPPTNAVAAAVIDN